ncbi:MAG: hypothetical protein WEC75_05700 [Dehalococcoidia bacterium]
MLRLLAFAVLASIVLSAAVCGTDDPQAQTPLPIATACPEDEPACSTAYQPPTPEAPHPEALRIFSADRTIRTLLDGKVAGTDYWLNFSAFSPNERGERRVAIDMVFQDPVVFTGEIPVFSDPCSGVGDEGDVPEDHSCRTEPRTYEASDVHWNGETRLLHAMIDLDRRRVVDLFNPAISGESVDDVIEHLDEHYDGSY